MPRSAVPSQMQQELLLNSLEERQWLATGYARTSHARDRTRAAWQEIATKLNSDGRGCLKTWQQWSKYWKDKKSAAKKKYSQMRLARQQTGGGAVEEIILSDIDQRIIALMGGEQFAVGDRELEINPFHEAATASVHEQPILPQEELQEPTYLVLNPSNVDSAGSAATASESVLQGYVESMAAEPGTVPQNVDTEHHISTLPPDNTPAPGPSAPSVHTAPAPAPAPPSVTSSPRRRRVVPRRRLLHSGTPPSQRFSQMSSLTERFLALEERRVEAEYLSAQNQQELLGILRNFSGAWTLQN